MSLTDEVATIRQHFSANVASAVDLQVLYDNDPRNAPVDETWMLVSLRDGESRQIEVGVVAANTHRTSGVMFVSIFTPVGVGDSVARLVVETVKSVFRNKVIGNTSFKAVSSSVGGLKGSWWQIVVTVPFEFDELA